MTGAAPIRLVPIQESAPKPEQLRHLQATLTSYLEIPVQVLDPFRLPQRPGHGEGLHSNEIVDALIEAFPQSDGFWTVAITDADLTVPGRDFVFGEATVGGAWAVVSLARLASSDRSAEVVAERLFKEVLHELGHLAGLGHCSTPTCVMRRSASVEAVDVKSGDFCEKCVSAFFQSERS